MLARCLVRGCPFRWPGGPDRLCFDHQDVAVAAPLDMHKSLWDTVVAASTPPGVTAPPGRGWGTGRRGV